jgi:hypothetical protein
LFQACVASPSTHATEKTIMEHTQEQLANALLTLGFQRTAYPSDKYQVFDNGTLRYLVDQNGNLRRGASVNSSIAANEAIADILRRAAESIAQQPEQQEGHAAQEQETDSNIKQTADNSPPQQPRQRGSSKQRVLIDLLTRTEGATITQIVAATDWQAHSVRGVISGVLKKKLGLHITSTKSSGGERVYRIHAAVTDAA